MSQYPYPQQPGYYPPAYEDPLDRLLAPARRAGILMFVLSGLLLLCGGCVSLGAMLPLNKMELPPEVMAELRNFEQQTGTGAGIIFVIMGVIVAIPAVVLLALAFFVRKGGAGSIVTSIVVVGLMALLVGYALLQGLGAPSAELIIPGVAMTLLVLLLVWLVQAIKNAGEVKDIRLGQQMQYWQAMQYQRQYAQPQQPPPAPGYYGQYPQQQPPYPPQPPQPPSV